MRERVYKTWTATLDLYGYSDYRPALYDLLVEKKETVAKVFTFHRMADHCRVQKTYLSRVLKGDGHLSEDQVYLACDYLGLSEDDGRYLELLRDRGRCCVRRRQRVLDDKIDEMRRAQSSSEAYLKAQPMRPDAADIGRYYLDPDIQIVHMFLTVKRYALATDVLARHLELEDEKMLDILAHLERLGLIRREKGRVVVTKESLHLSSDSALHLPNLLLLRARAHSRLMHLSAEKDLGFSVVFTADRETRDKIRQRLLDCLSECESLVAKAPAENVFQLDLTLLPWD